MAARSAAGVLPLAIYPANLLAWRLIRSFIAGALRASLSRARVVIAPRAVVVVNGVIWCASNVAGYVSTVFLGVRIDVRLSCGACNTCASSYYKHSNFHIVP